ncbi:MAG: aminotransferase [Elusimicrobiales bacterium]|nr:aminotransferase [Elusimicrobiales bacterium]
MNSVFSDSATTIFESMSRLAAANDAVNLGQGFPDDPGPEEVRRKAAENVLGGWNQYAPMMGLSELRRAAAVHYERFQGLDLDWEKEVMVTSGATEALAGALMAILEPGDEVVLFQPMYDAYLPLVRRAGGIPRFVTLRSPGWRLNEEDLKRAFGPKTRAVLFNDPLNPAGTAFPREDLELLGRYVLKYNAIAICDEVWEHTVFDGPRHIPLMALPGLRDRCVKIGSAGKIFSLTGWKVGLVCAAPELMKVLSKAHQYLTFCTPPNLQSAVAYGLGLGDTYYEGLKDSLRASHDRFAKGLTGAGYKVLPSQATYFLSVDLGPAGDDAGFCARMVKEARVAAIPVSAFYSENPQRGIVRFCFAKKDATLDEALRRLSAWKY